MTSSPSKMYLHGLFDDKVQSSFSKEVTCAINVERLNKKESIRGIIERWNNYFHS
jgi:hypothetical protein